MNGNNMYICVYVQCNKRLVFTDDAMKLVCWFQGLVYVHMYTAEIIITIIIISCERFSIQVMLRLHKTSKSVQSECMTAHLHAIIRTYSETKHNKVHNEQRTHTIQSRAYNTEHTCMHMSAT